MKKTRDLFWTFLKIGAFTFGGGYAMVALLEREFVEDKQWLSREEFLDMVAIAVAVSAPHTVRIKYSIYNCIIAHLSYNFKRFLDYFA